MNLQIYFIKVEGNVENLETHEELLLTPEPLLGKYVGEIFYRGISIANFS